MILKNPTVLVWRFLSAAMFIVPCVCGSGCQSFDFVDCSIIGGTSRYDGGYFSVTVLVENRSAEILDLSQVRFEMTTFDHQDRVLDREHLFQPKGAIQPFDNDRIPLVKLKRETDGSISRSRIILKDQSGNVLSEISVPEIAGSPIAGPDPTSS